MGDRDTIRRSILPIPDPQHVGVTTYDAKEPAAKYPRLSIDRHDFTYSVGSRRKDEEARFIKQNDEHSRIRTGRPFT